MTRNFQPASALGKAARRALELHRLSCELMLNDKAVGVARAEPLVSSGRFLTACRREPTDVRPVWFMRQAGRYMKAYRDIRAHHSILEICKRPDLAAAVTLQPIDVLDVDAAIIFADLLLPVEPMGLKLEFRSGEGPHIEKAIADVDDVHRLSTANTGELGYVAEALQSVNRQLAGKVPVIGFVGAPFTLASYMIEGGSTRTFLKTKNLMFSNEAVWDQLMNKLVRVLGDFAALQVRAGAAAIQVFDSWVGALSPGDYVRYVQPYSKVLIEHIRALNIPVIHFGTGTGGFLREFADAGGDVIGVDWRVNIDAAWAEMGHRAAIQGNLDPIALFASLPELKQKVSDLLQRTGTRAGHIVNLGHGILPETPVENVRAVVQMVREFSSAQ